MCVRIKSVIIKKRNLGGIPLNKITKRIIITTILTLTLVLSACGAKRTPNGKDGVVAKVNGTDIKLDDYVVEYAAQRNIIELASIKQGQDPEDFFNQKDPSTGVPMGMKLREVVLKNLEQAEIIRQKLEEDGYTLDESAVQKEIDGYVESYGSKEAFTQALEQQGYSEAFLRNYVKNRIMFKEFYDRFSKNFESTDEDAKAYYDKNQDKYTVYNADHILVDNEDLAKEIKKELEGGADFATLAKEKSIDPSAKENGGALGDFGPGEMVAEFEEGVKKTNEGEISDPVKSVHGYHIIKVNKKSVKTFDEVKEEIKTQLSQEKFDEWVNSLEKDAKIDEYIDLRHEVEIPEEYKIKNTQGETQGEDVEVSKKDDTKPVEDEVTPANK